MKYRLKKKTKVVLSVDIGIQHLGISVSLLDENYEFRELVWIDLIDITSFRCKKECKLYHSNTISDWLEHVFQDQKEFFVSADVILIEKQPLCGLVAVEQLVFYKFRDKAHLISPRTVHKYFSIQNYDYEKRKEYSEKIATSYIPPHLQEQLSFYDRKHDITDSILFTLYWSSKKYQEGIIKERIEKRKQAYSEFLETQEWEDETFFNYFRYIQK